jgi:hypothetical protein
MKSALVPEQHEQPWLQINTDYDQMQSHVVPNLRPVVAPIHSRRMSKVPLAWSVGGPFSTTRLIELRSQTPVMHNYSDAIMFFW